MADTSMWKNRLYQLSVNSSVTSLKPTMVMWCRIDDIRAVEQEVDLTFYPTLLTYVGSDTYKSDSEWLNIDNFSFDITQIYTTDGVSLASPTYQSFTLNDLNNSANMVSQNTNWESKGEFFAGVIDMEDMFPGAEALLTHFETDAYNNSPQPNFPFVFSDTAVSLSGTFPLNKEGKMWVQIGASGTGTYNRQPTVGVNTVHRQSGIRLWNTQVMGLFFTLPSIINISNGYLGDVLDISIVNSTVSDLSTLKHTITYTLGNTTGTIIEDTSLTELQWIVPTSLMSEFADGVSFMPCKITVETRYADDGTLIGTETFDRYYFLDVATDNFVNIKITDTNPIGVNATQDETQLIRYISNPKVETEILAHKSIQEATLTVGETVNQLWLTSGTESSDCPGGYPYVYVGHPYIYENIEHNGFTATVYNSDGTVNVTLLNKPLIPYVKLTTHTHGIKFSPNGFIEFTGEGNIFNEKFGSAGKQNTVSAYYRIAIANQENIEDKEWIAANTPTIGAGGTYTFTQRIDGVDIEYGYYVQIKVADLVMEATTEPELVIGKPVFDWSKEDFHVHVPFINDEYIELAEDRGIYGKYGDTSYQALVPCNSSGDTTLGYGNYQNEEGATKIYGDIIDVIYNKELTINSRTYGENKVLWQGEWVGYGTQQIPLSEPVSKQPNGIVLVFSLIDNGTVRDVSINSFFVSKKEVELLEAAPHTYLMGINAGFSTIGAKYLYIYDNSIGGHEGNTQSGANSGITFNNGRFVLRYVIGV